MGGVPPGWFKQGRRQYRGRCGGVPAGWEGFLQDGANRGVDSTEEDVEVFAALDLDEGEELVGLHTRLLLFSVPCNHRTKDVQDSHGDLAVGLFLNKKNGESRSV